MNKFLRLLPLVVLLLTFGACKQTEQTSDTPPMPNIIYILADDLGYGDLGITGQEKFGTPNIDQLAKDGMLFTRHYAGSTVCAPSRSALMTGQHTGHTFIRGNKRVSRYSQYPLKASIETLAELLQASGYTTGAFGKWGLGAVGSEGDPNSQGFDQFFGYNSQSLAHNYYPRFLWQNDKKVMLEENQGKKTGIYAPDLIHEKAMNFLEKNKDSSFFMYYPSVIPHAELLVPEKYLAKYRDKFLPEKVFVGVDDGGKYRKGSYGSQDEAHAAFVAMIHLLDEQVGEIRRKVEELGIADRTLIIFSSDNGPHLEGGADPDYFNSNGGLRGYKRDLYEGGIRVPMIATWPGKIGPNSTSSHVSAFWDFYPTVCELIEADVPEGLDGISFLPELIGGEQKQHDFLYWEFHEQKGRQAVLWQNWKGIRLDMGDAPRAPIELYNLDKDPGEKDDLASQYPEVVAKIDSMMSKAHEKSEVFSFEFEKE